jgi:hypothetical protein
MVMQPTLRLWSIRRADSHVSSGCYSKQEPGWGASLAVHKQFLSRKNLPEILGTLAEHRPVSPVWATLY